MAAAARTEAAASAERVRVSQEETSTTSHASSSRVGVSSSAGSNKAALKPLSLADALARAGGDATRALDEVLAERNQFCLEANRLQTENVRIWNLMRRPKREPSNNETVQSATASMRNSHEGPPVGPVGLAGPSSSARGSPLAAPPLAPRRRGVETDSASPSSDSLRDRISPEFDATSQGRLSSASSSQQQPISTLRPGSSDPGAASAAASSLPSASASSKGRGTSSEVVADGAGRTGTTGADQTASTPSNTASAETQKSEHSQHSSIMQQRAAAQQAARAQSEGHGHRTSFESQDYEAVDGSSAAPSDDGESHLTLSHSDSVTADDTFVQHNTSSSSGAREPSEASTTVAPRTFAPSESPAKTGQRPNSQLPQQRQTTQQPLHEMPKSSARETFANQSANGSTSSLSRPNYSSPASPATSNFTKIARTMSVDSITGSSAPRLDASRLSHARLSVVGSNLRSNERGREVISFYIAIVIDSLQKASSSRSGNASPSPSYSWRIEKLYSDVLALDARLKQKHGKTAAKRIGSAQLPDRNLFKDHAPSKVDQRKAILDAYLQNLLAIPLPDKDDFCTFLCTDVVPVKMRDPQAMTKEGFLTKKGQNMGRWVTRLYKLSGDRLDYYESRGGALLGSISVTGAQIGRQQRSATAELDENSYRHAFLILEKRLPTSASDQPQMVRHVLCAESDEERDEWVDVLVRTIAELDKGSGPVAAPDLSKSPRLQSRRRTGLDNGRDVGMSISTSSSTTFVNQPNIPRSPGRSRADSNQAELSRREAESASMPTASSSSPLASRNAAQVAHAIPLDGGALPHVSSPAALHYDGTESQRPAVNAVQQPYEAQLPLSPSQRQIALSQGQPPMYRGPRKASQEPYVNTGAAQATNTYDQPRGTQQHSTSKDMQRPSTPENRSTATLVGGLPPGGSASKGTNSGNNGNTHTTGGQIRPSISGPMNGAPIPTGFKFGGKDDAGSSSSSSNAIMTASSGAVSSAGQGTTSQSASGEGNKKRFWQRFGGGGHGSGNSVDKNAPPKKVFGVSLAESIAASNISEGLELPSVVYRCIEYLEKRNAASEEGIYRLSGSSAVIKSLKDRFNALGDVDLLAPTEPMHDPHAVAGLLKTFFRELPSSVLTSELHLDFMRANDIMDRKERVNELGQLVSMLPLPNYSVLRTLCSHLIKIIERQDENKMTMRNVGIVFSPTLGIPAGVFALFLTEFDWVFYTDARGEPAPRLIEEDIIPPDTEELGKESISLQRGQGWEGSMEGSEHFSDATSQENHTSSNAEVGATLAPATPRPRGKKDNRTSWIAGNALHAADGKVHDLSTVTSSSRHNRNSLSYNEEEADKLLGGPQGRNRLSSHIEEIDHDLTGEQLPDDLQEDGAVLEEEGDEDLGQARGERKDRDARRPPRNLLQSPVGDEALLASPSVQLSQGQQVASFDTLQPPSPAATGGHNGAGNIAYAASPLASPRFAPSTKSSSRSREASASQQQQDHTLQLPGASYDQFGRPQGTWSSASSPVPPSPAGSTRSHRSAPRPPLPTQPSPSANTSSHQFSS